MSKLKELEKRLKGEPDNLGLRVTVAAALIEAGRHEEAVELYRSVAIVYRDQGRSQQAIAVCRSILEIAPDDVRCHALLAALVTQHKGRSARDSQQIYGDDIVLEVGTPPPQPQRDPPPSVPPPRAAMTPTGGISLPRTPTPRTLNTPPAGVGRPPRAPTAPPATTRAGVTVPFPPRPSKLPSQSKLDETPLPIPLPYHVADPTTRALVKHSEADLATPDPEDLPAAEGVQTRPGSDDGTAPSMMQGIASAARRISASLISQDDLALELETRQRPRIEAHELDDDPAATVPVERVIEVDDDDAKTPPPKLDLRAASSNEDDDEGVPTLSDDEEPTRPRDTSLDLLIRTEARGPLGSAFFQPLPPDRREAVLDRFHHKSVTKGTTVIRQGEVGHSLVVVVSGQLVARVNRPPAQPIELGLIGTGEFIGEDSLLARMAAPAQVVAHTDCELLLLTPRDFYEIAGAYPALWAELKDVAQRRKRELESQLRR